MAETQSERVCGHGRLYTEPCADCEIIWQKECYLSAIKDMRSAAAKLRTLGAWPIPKERGNG
jgi:hypothetical protein